MLASPNKEVTLSAEELKGLVDLKMSQGELDLVKSKETRPTLGQLALPGVKVGQKMIPTVVNLDSNDAVKVLMDKAKKTGNTVKKYQDVDKWANQHLDDIKRAMTNQNGDKITDNVAIIETAGGDYRIIALQPKEGVDLSKEEDFVEGLGDKFTAAVNKNVFKNENIMVVPKQTPESINMGLKDHTVVSKVYETDDIDTLEKYALNGKHSDQPTTEQTVDTFLNNLNDKDRQTLEDFNITTREDIMNDFMQGDWSSIEDYIDNIKNCK
jgi:mRNA-degrading endonuclease HigB of HigAB toxin-antitoxin module